MATRKKNTSRSKAKSSSNSTPRAVPCDPLMVQLDAKNPRLTREEEDSSQEELLRIMIEKFKLVELGESIVSMGYLPFDPLVGWKHNEIVTVLEGNRRIAAIKLLLSPDLAPERHRTKWRELSKRLSASHRRLMQEVRIDVFENRDQADLTAYIGFRHVTGVLKWPALEKASFIAHLIEKQKLSYAEIAERLGSYPRHVEKHYVAYQVVQQAVDEGVPGSQKVESAFGVLLRALQTAGVRKFLGIEYPNDPKGSRKPVPDDHVQELKAFIEWTFGAGDKPPVLRDSRQLTKWGRVLQSPEAVRYLKSATEPRFERAWFKSGGQAESLAEALHAAADRLEEGVPIVLEHVEERDVQEGVARCALFFSQILRHFPEVRDRYKIKVSDV